MPRRRKPERDKAKRLYLESRGKLSPKEIGKKLGLPAGRVRKWKCEDKWEEELHRKRKGGQPGNKNAKGNKGGTGAPSGNTNAETHGAYSVPRMEHWSEEERKEIETLPCQFQPVADRQLKKLWAKQHDLERRIAALGQEPEEKLYLDRVMTMEMPGGGDMRYVSESSQHSRRMALEGELNRVQGRINKLLDSIRGREQEEKRLAFDREKFEFEKQKVSGVFETPEDAGAEEIVET